MLTNCNITIYNKYIENREVKYQKSYIYGVHWEDSEGVNVLSSGIESGDTATIFIPFYNGENYLKPKSFYRNRLDNFTLQHEDIIVKGIIEDDFVSVKELEKTFDDVRMITKVDTLDFGSKNMRHWEVGAK